MKKLLVLLVTLPLLFQCSDTDKIVNLPEDAQPYYAFKIEDPMYDEDYVRIGGQSEITVYLDSIGDRPLSNFNLSIAFQDTMLTVLDVIPDPALKCWDIFNYTVSRFEDENGTPIELLRITAIADDKHPWSSPPNCSDAENSNLEYPDKLFEISVQVTSDYAYECWCLPLYFYWLDCDDNTVADADYSAEYVSRGVYDIAWIGEEHYKKLIPDDNEIDAVDHIYGIFSDCMVTHESTLPQKASVIDFYDGCLELSCSGPEIWIGDLNLNYVPFEIADAILFVDYFIYGESVFKINLEGQIAESDVNRDDVPLTLADLTYLIRVLYGDAVAWDELQHYQTSAYISIENDTVYVECDQDLGAVSISFYDRVNSKSLLESFTLRDDYINGFTNVIIYKMGRESIPAGKTALMVLSDLAYIHKFEAAGYLGECVTSVIKQ